MSTAVLCGERPRKLAIKFKLGAPLPVPRTVRRKRGRVRVDLPGGETKHVDIEAGVVRDPYRGYQVGQVVDRPKQGGAFTRALVSTAAKAQAASIVARREERAARAQAERENAEAFAYLEGLAALDEYDRAAFDSAMERTDLE